MGGDALANGIIPPRPTITPSPLDQTFGSQQPVTDGPPAAFVLRRDAAEKHSRIIIPQKYLPSGNTVPRRFLPSGGATPNISLDAPRQKAVDAGLLLATVMAGGGLTVVFVRRRNVKTAVGISVVTVLLTVTLGTAMAAVPNPLVAPNPPPIGVGAAGQLPFTQPVESLNLNPPRIAVEATGAGSQISVDIVATGDEIILILGKDAPQPGP
jgi:hypothetical protein